MFRKNEMIVGYGATPTWVYNVYEVDLKEYRWFESGYWKSSRVKIKSSLTWEEATYFIREKELVPKTWDYGYRQPDVVRWVGNHRNFLRPDYRNRRLVWKINENIEIVRDREWWSLGPSELHAARLDDEKRGMRKHKSLDQQYEREPFLKILLKMILDQINGFEVDVESVYQYCDIDPITISKSATVDISVEKKIQIAAAVRILFLLIGDLKKKLTIKKIKLRKMEKDEIFRRFSDVLYFDPDDMQRYISTSEKNAADNLLHKLIKVT
jgi:hypothetical protein